MDQVSSSDRPYVASSFFSVAIARVFASALNGQCTAKPDLVELIMPFSVNMRCYPATEGESLLKRLFEPLGYKITAMQYTLDEKFPEWGDSPIFL